MNLIPRNIGKLFAIAAILAMPGQYQVIQQGLAWFQMVKNRPSNESVLETLSASVCGQRLCDSCEKICNLSSSSDSGMQPPVSDLKWKIAERLPTVLIAPPSPGDFHTDYEFDISDFHSQPPTAPPQRA